MIFLIFALGAVGGSFINALGMGLVRGRFAVRSRCDHCQALLRPVDLVPLVSYFALRGHCRACGERIHWRHPLSELVLGIIFVLSYILHNLWPGALIMFFASILFLLVLTDLEAKILPDQVTLPALGLTFSLIAVTREPQSVIGATILGAAFFGIQYALSQGRWVGDGDIRLGGLLGAMLGDWRLLVLALTLSYIIGAIISLGLMATHRATFKSQIPFAPFLALGTFIILLVGDRILVYAF